MMLFVTGIWKQQSVSERVLSMCLMGETTRLIELCGIRVGMKKVKRKYTLTDVTRRFQLSYRFFNILHWHTTPDMRCIKGRWVWVDLD